MGDIALGKCVQIDHMSATKNDVSVKHFMAQDQMADRKSKHIHAQIYSRAVFVPTTNIAHTQHCKAVHRWSIYESIKQRPRESQII